MQAGCKFAECALEFPTPIILQAISRFPTAQQLNYFSQLLGCCWLTAHDLADHRMHEACNHRPGWGILQMSRYTWPYVDVSSICASDPGRLEIPNMILSPVAGVFCRSLTAAKKTTRCCFRAANQATIC